MNLQALADGMSAQWMRERAETQMTLGELIDRLGSLPSDLKIGIGNAHSYRGYYSDFALEEVTPTPVSELLEECKDAMGKCFEGYKGGDFYMHAGAPVWIASYGCCGRKLMAINYNGELETAEDE